MKHLLTLATALVVGICTAAAQHIVPEPASVTPGKGVHTRPVDKDRIDIRIDSSAFGSPEAYRLEVTPKKIRITGASDAGVFYALQTLRQLGDENQANVPCVTVEDSPRFSYRALMLDPARHFLPVADVKRFIDAMAMYKFNVLHFHLTDDQGWRVEIRKYPRLTEIGSTRAETDGDGKPHGGYYTQEQLRELVAYAADRHITIVPEFDIPGHSVAAVVSYPWLSCRAVDTLQVRTTAGVSPDLLCAGNDSTVTFIQDILREMCDIFPSPMFHIGGDEAPLDRWGECPKCRARKATLGLESDPELMAWLLRQASGTLAESGKRPMVWYETDVALYSAGTTVCAWRDGLTPTVIDSARTHGWPVVSIAGEHAYFDYPEAEADRPKGGAWMPVISLKRAYAFEPADAPVIGVEAALWSEYLPTIDSVFYRAFPRALALSEAAWSRPERRSWDAFKAKMPAQMRLMDANGIPYRKPSAAELK